LLFVVQTTESVSTAGSHVTTTNVTSNMTTTNQLAAVTSAVATVARLPAGRVVGNASYGLAVVYAESVTESGFDGTYTCFARYNDSDLPLYTITYFSEIFHSSSLK